MSRRRVLPWTLLAGAGFVFVKGTAALIDILRPPSEAHSEAPVEKRRESTLSHSFANGIEPFVAPDPKRPSNWERTRLGAYRPAELRLWADSAHARDFALDVSARIVRRGLTLVHHATDFDNYYEVKVQSNGPGDTQVVRRVCLNGVEQPGQSVSVRPWLVMPENLHLFRLTSTNGSLTLSVANHATEHVVLDSWDCERNKSGAVGFMGAPLDVAELYSARLTFSL